MLTTRIWNGHNVENPLRAFNDLTIGEKHIAYCASNETSRVRYLLQKIKSQDPMIYAAKITIRADEIKKK